MTHIPIKVYEEIKVTRYTDVEMYVSKNIQWINGTPYTVEYLRKGK